MLTILKIGRLVPELSGLGYLVKYPSPPSSGTNLPISRIYLGQLKKTRQISTRVHQARVPICLLQNYPVQISQQKKMTVRLVPESTKLGYMGNSFFFFFELARIN